MDQQDREQIKIDIEVSEKIIRDRSALLIQRSNELNMQFYETWSKCNSIVLLYRKDNPRY